jgi:exportin-T
MENLEAAVQCALSSSTNAEMKAQATQYCEQIKSSNDGWQLCLNLFIKTPPSTPEVRYFALQVVEETVRNRTSILDKTQQDLIKQTLWEWVKTSLDTNEKPFIKNKLAQAIVQIFKIQYPENWPTFFDDLISLVDQSMNTPRSDIIVDFFLRICSTIDEEVVSLLINRTDNELQKNTFIKDTMREGAVMKLVEYWFKILMASCQTNPTIANKCLNIIGQYVMWIDIKLIVTDTFMTALYQFMNVEDLRMAATECLCSIISKGMRPLEKLQLIQLLNIPTLLGQLKFDNIDFEEQIAKLVNLLGVELTSICDDVKDVPEAKAMTYSYIQTLFPYMLKLLANEYDDTSSALFPFVTSYTNLLKQQKKINFADVPNFQQDILELLKVIISKMKYDEDIEFSFGEDEDEALFIEMRKSLKVFYDALFAIDESVSTQTVFSVISSTFDRINIEKVDGSNVSLNSSINASWSEAELALYLIYIFGESKRSTLNYEPGGIFYQMIEKMFQSNVIYYPHNSIPIMYFEIITRYTNFFDIHTQFIPNVLEAFVCSRGLHNSEIIIKTRLNYLFARFVKAMKPKLAPYVQTVLTNIQTLLIIQPTPITLNNLNSHPYNDFYLFEAVGTLISLETIPMEQQSEYLGTIIQPMLNTIDEIISKSLYQMDTPKNMQFTHQLNLIIRTIGSIGHSFPHINLLQSNITPPWIVIYNKTLESMVVVLERLSDQSSIRESVRYTLQRLIPCMGNEIVKFIIPMMNGGLLTKSSKNELSSLLTSFYDLLIHKFKNNALPIMNELLYPIVEKVFIFLNQPANGTDEIISMFELRRAYMNFLGTIFTSSLQNILISENNNRHLPMIMESVVHCARDSADVQSQKAALSVLAKMVNVWGGITEETSIPGFADFIYQQIVTIIFEIVMKDDFNFQAAETLLILNEISNLHLTILQKQGVKYAEYLLSYFFPSINCPSQAARDFVDAMQNSDKKTFSKYLKSFFQAMKSQ